MGKTIPVFNLASNHQWNVTLSDVTKANSRGRRTVSLARHVTAWQKRWRGDEKIAARVAGSSTLDTEKQGSGGRSEGFC